MSRVALRLLLAAALAARPIAGTSCDRLTVGERGKCFESAGDWVRAEAAYRAEMQAAPDSIETVAAHARTLVRLHQPFDALIELEDLLKRRPVAVAAAKLYAALCDSVLGDHAKAQETLENIGRMVPRDAEAWEALGTHELDRGKPEAAVTSFQRARELKPEDALIAASLAYSLAEAGDEEHARTWFAKALALGRSHPLAAVYLLYGDFLLKHARTKESLPVLSRAIELDPHSGEAYYYRALANEKAVALDRAQADAEAALRESGERVDAHMVLQRVYRKLGDEARMQAEARKIEELQAAKESEQAQGRVLRDNLNHAEPLLAQQKFAEAIPYYEEIVRSLPGFYEAWFALGVSYSQTGKWTQAEDAFRRYLSYQPLSADGHASYGLLLESMKRNDDARKELEEALRLDPSMDEVKKALERLRTGLSR